MTQDEVAEAFPIAIFLDTNILDALPEDLRSGDLSALVEDAANVGARVFIPDVVAREWRRHRMERFFKNYEDYQNNRDYLREYFSKIPGFEVTSENFREKFTSVLTARLRNSGCRLLAPPRASIRGLTIRAVWEESPFRNSNRGFKDELVVLSMLKLVRRGWNYRTYVLVTRDNDFDAKTLEERFGRRAKRFERVGSLRAARELLGAKLDELRKRRIAEMEREMLDFLGPHWNAICDALQAEFRKKGLSMWTISKLGQEDAPASSSIRRIVRVTPNKISTVDVGGEDESNHEIPVTIRVETTVTLEIEEYKSLFAALFERVGPDGRRPLGADTGAQIKEIDIVRELPVQAVVRRTDEGHLTDLRFVEMRPDHAKALQDTRERSDS